MTPAYTLPNDKARAIIFGICGLVIYLLMINVTLARIEAISGQQALDLRPFGYTALDAAELFNNLGTEGRSYYLTRQLPLDLIYPAMLALTLISIIRLFSFKSGAHFVAKIGVLLAAGTAFFDYAENALIAGMLVRFPNVPEGLVQISSITTQLKSGLTTGAVTIALGFVIFKVLRPSHDRDTLQT